MIGADARGVGFSRSRMAARLEMSPPPLLNALDRPALPLLARKRPNPEPQSMGILLRWLGAFALLSATVNPTRWNYVH